MVWKSRYNFYIIVKVRNAMTALCHDPFDTTIHCCDKQIRYWDKLVRCYGGKWIRCCDWLIRFCNKLIWLSDKLIRCCDKIIQYCKKLIWCCDKLIHCCGKLKMVTFEIWTFRHLELIIFINFFSFSWHLRNLSIVP